MVFELQTDKLAPDLGEGEFYPASLQESVEVPFVELDEKLRVLSASPAFRSAFLQPGERCEGRSLAALSRGGWDVPSLLSGLAALPRGRKRTARFEIEGEFGERGPARLRIDALLLPAASSRPARIALIIGEATGDGGPKAEFRPLTRWLEHLVEERTRCVRVLQDIAVIANEAETLEEALARGIERVCNEFEWPVGHAYLTSRDDPMRYVDSGIWWLAPGGSFEEFQSATIRLCPRPGQDLVGHVAMTARPAWMPDLTADPLFLRKSAAAAAGLRSALAFPILVGRRVAGVVEFYAYEENAPDSTLLEGLGQLGTQLGRVAERGDLERRIANVLEEERRRFGQDLHDTLGQQITGLGLLLGALKPKIETDPGGSRKLLEAIEEIVEEAKGQLRALESGVLPVKVDARGLMHALESMAAQTASQFGCRCDFACEREVPLADNFTATQLYYIAKEAVHNAIKHGRAARVILRLAGEKGLLRLEIEDDGVGMEHVTANPRGFGLGIMRYRARLIGADLSITSRRGEGVRVTCSLAREGEDA